MPITNECQKKQAAAGILLNELEKAGRQMESGQQTDVFLLEKILEFFQGYLKRYFVKHGTASQASILQTSDLAEKKPERKNIFEDFKNEQRLLRAMRISLEQLKKGADRAAAEFSGSVRGFVVLLRRQHNFLPEQNFKPDKRKSEKNSFPKNIKGIFLVD